MTRLSFALAACMLLAPIPAPASVTDTSGTLGDALLKPKLLEWWRQLLSQIQSFLMSQNNILLTWACTNEQGESVSA